MEWIKELRSIGIPNQCKERRVSNERMECPLKTWEGIAFVDFVQWKKAVRRVNCLDLEVMNCIHMKRFHGKWTIKTLEISSVN